MIIMKRNGSEEQFNIYKIISAISKANAVDNKYELTKEQIESIANNIQSECLKLKGIPSVEDIQDMVENRLMAYPEDPKPGTPIIGSGITFSVSVVNWDEQNISTTIPKE